MTQEIDNDENYRYCKLGQQWKPRENFNIKSKSPNCRNCRSFLDACYYRLGYIPNDRFLDEKYGKEAIREVCNEGAWPFHKNRASGGVKHPIINGAKKCGICDEEKSIEEFRKGKQGYDSYCSDCEIIYNSCYRNLKLDIWEIKRLLGGESRKTTRQWIIRSKNGLCIGCSGHVDYILDMDHDEPIINNKKFYVARALLCRTCQNKIDRDTHAGRTQRIIDLREAFDSWARQVTRLKIEPGPFDFWVSSQFNLFCFVYRIPEFPNAPAT